jgi:hypothetical protein
LRSNYPEVTKLIDLHKSNITDSDLDLLAVARDFAIIVGFAGGKDLDVMHLTLQHEPDVNLKREDVDSIVLGWLPDAVSNIHFYIMTVSSSRNAPVRVEKIGRNDPCLCGSGKKYKKCCGK